jgi:hypothetical protein
MLPNLQEGTKLPEGRTFWLRTKTQDRIHCDARWKKVQNWTPPLIEVEQALEDWFQYGGAVAFLCRQMPCLTETTRYWGHEHDYRNNLISVRWGGIVPREVPCDRRESESLRDGPFSNFRSSSNTIDRQGAGKSPLTGERSEGKELSEADAEVLEGQNSGEEEAPETEGDSVDGPRLTDASEDEDGEGDEFNDTSEAEHLVTRADEDEIDVAPEAGDEPQPSQWQSDVLCVADPFIQTKVEFASRGITALSDVILIAEPGWTHQTERHRALSGRLSACGDATRHGGKPSCTPVVRPAHPASVTPTTAAWEAKAAGPRGRKGWSRTHSWGRADVIVAFRRSVDP